MEYTYMIVFPALAFTHFFIVSDNPSAIFRWLLVFAVVFHIWQRYIMVWGYSKTMYDSNYSFVAFMRVWGLVLSLLPLACVWWAWRLQYMRGVMAVVVGQLVFVLSLLIYEGGLSLVVNIKSSEELDDFS